MQQRTPTFKSSLCSRLFGLFASKEFPSWFQAIINKTYVALMHIDLGEFEKATAYKSLNALFTRTFKVPRVFNTDETTFISPCDSRISASGIIENETLLQIKGHEYHLGGLLSDYVSKENKAKLAHGTFINFYLSPSDYHRYHAPFDMQIKRAIHIPGKLYPVNFKWLQKVPGLFIENERVVLECHTKNNELFYMVFVGALNVGKMVFNFDATIQTNANAHNQQCYYYADLHVSKGDELGRFEMGSTIVMLLEKDLLTCELEEMRHIRFGDVLGTTSHA